VRGLVIWCGYGRLTAARRAQTHGRQLVLMPVFAVLAVRVLRQAFNRGLGSCTQGATAHQHRQHPSLDTNAAIMQLGERVADAGLRCPRAARPGGDHHAALGKQTPVGQAEGRGVQAAWPWLGGRLLVVPSGDGGGELAVDASVCASLGAPEYWLFEAAGMRMFDVMPIQFVRRGRSVRR
jgi:hypothetical protein